LSSFRPQERELAQRVRETAGAKQRPKIILAVFMLWAAWLSAEYGLLGPNSYVRLHNNGDTILPAMIALRVNLSHGQLGFWAPQWASGVDRGALAFTNDLRGLPFLFLPGWLAYAGVMFAQRLVAGYFAFQLLTEDLELSFWPAMCGALGYALFAQEAMNHGWAGFTLYDGLIVPGIPFVLWALSRIRAGSWLHSALWSLLAAAVIALTGSLVFSIFVAPLVVYWFGIVDERRNARFWVFVVLFFVAWGLLAALLIWPSALFAYQSNRAIFASETIWGWSSRVAGAALTIRDNFLFLLLGLAGLIASRVRNRKLIALLALIGFCLIISVFYSLLAKTVRPYFPILSGFSVERFELLIPFLSLTTAAIGIDQLGQGWLIGIEHQCGQRFESRLSSTIALVLIAFLIYDSGTIKLRTVGELLDRHNYAALYSNPDLQHLAHGNAGTPPFRVVTVALGDVVPLYPPGATWAYGFESADGFLTMQSLRYLQYWEQVIAPVLKAEPARYNFVHFWGSQLYLFAPRDFSGTKLDFDNFYQLKLLSLANVRYVISPVPISGPSLSLLPSTDRDMQILWAAQGRVRRLASILRGHNPGIPLYVYVNGGAFPRFFLVGKAEVMKNSGELLARLSSATLDELGSTALLEGSDASKLPLEKLRSGAGTVSIALYTADHIKLATQSKSALFLIATNSFSPYWRAWIDGSPATLVPVDHTFQGVFLEAGSHSVSLKYEPPYAFQ